MAQTPSLDVSNNAIHLKSVGSSCTIRFAQLPVDGPYAFQAKIRAAGGTNGVTVAPGNQAIEITVTSAEREYRQVFPAVSIADNPYLTLTFPPGEFWISEIQLEQGNVLTGWKLSTTDVVESVQQMLDIAKSSQAAYVSVSTPGSTAKKVPDYTIPDFTLAVGQRVACLFFYANTADNPTLNVNGTGEYAIVTSDGTVLTAANSARIGWTNNAVVSFVWDGRFWRIDDSASLVKIDNILTENIYGTHGWINLGGGVFNFDNKLVWDGSVLTITGEIVSSKISGGDVRISGAEYGVNQSDVQSDTYVVGAYLQTEESNGTIRLGPVTTLNLKNIKSLEMGVFGDKSGRIPGGDYTPDGNYIIGSKIRLDPNKVTISPADCEGSYDGAESVHVSFKVGSTTWGPGDDLPARDHYITRDEVVFDTIPVKAQEFQENNVSLENKYLKIPTIPFNDDALNGDVTLASGTTTTTIDSFTLPAGTYLVILNTEFGSNTTGRRYLCISDSNTGGAINHSMRVYSAPINSGATTAKIMGILSPTAQTTYYIRGYQNSGSSLTVSNRLTAIKLTN